MVEPDPQILRKDVRLEGDVCREPGCHEPPTVIPEGDVSHELCSAHALTVPLHIARDGHDLDLEEGEAG